ncbi:MAG: hypothetical protein IJ837_01455 [Clostridia bacterium]|nr:hypothetical protein [Clostridia bacterium]
MQNITIHFVSDFQVFLKLNSQILGSLNSPSDTLSCECDFEQKLVLEVLPINSQKAIYSIPFAAEIFVEKNKINSPSNFLEITNYYDGVFEVKILPMQTKLSYKQVFVKNIKVSENISINIFDDGFYNLEIITKNKVYHHTLSEKTTDMSCEYFLENETEFLFFKGKTTSNKDFLLVLADFFCNLEISADLIECSHQKITTLLNQNDIAKHGIVCVYVLDKNQFKLNEEYTVFLDKNPQFATDPKIIPWAFAESLNIGDLKLARKYLTNDLNIMLDDEHLLNFFGDYEEIKWNKYKNMPNALCFVYENNPKEVKIYKFEIDKNKITNIILLEID